MTSCKSKQQSKTTTTPTHPCNQMRWFSKVINWLKGLIYQPRKPITPKARKATLRRGKDHYGAHYYLSDLLDQIDQTFKGMDALKRADKSSYNIFSKVAFNVADSNLIVQHGFQNHWQMNVNDIPMWGGMNLTTKTHSDYEDKYAIKSNEKDGWVRPHFIMFRRVKRPYNVQPTNKITLELGFLYNHESVTNTPPWLDLFYVEVDKEGNMRPLKCLSPEVVKIKNNKSFVRTRWKLPENTLRFCEHHNLDLTQYVHDVTWYAINMAKSVDTGIQVRVSKGKKRVTFAIDMLRTPYFFNDRDKVVNENGQTKKIFHIVRAHERTTAGGEKKIIKSHTKGLRKFKWNGYDVNIYLAGKHTLSANAITNDAYCLAANEPIPATMMKEEELARKGRRNTG